jgi:hypothetical protein
MTGAAKKTMARIKAFMTVPLIVFEVCEYQ